MKRSISCIMTDPGQDELNLLRTTAEICLEIRSREDGHAGMFKSLRRNPQAKEPVHSWKLLPHGTDFDLLRQAP